MNEKQREILDAGQELIQTRGYDGFSYRDIADRVGIRSATIHYYFPAKADLVLALAGRYRADFAAAVATIDDDPGTTALERLERFAGLFRHTLSEGRNCLCGMLAAGVETVPVEANHETRGFFDDQLAWVERTLTAGASDHSLRPPTDRRRFATVFIAAMEGAMLIARANNDPAQLDDVVAELLRPLRPPS